MAADGVYRRVIQAIFDKHYRPNSTGFDFKRNEITEAARALGVDRPDNLGDLVYYFRYRHALPQKILDACGPDEEWVIRGVQGAESQYRFLKVPATRITPQASLYQTKVPSATPEIVARYAQGDEQALLAHVRYNRLLDIFTGVVTYSLQSHLRTKVLGVQMETDELYVGVDRSGAQYILPVQAKGGADRLGRVQLEQDIALCQSRFPMLACRPVAVQFMRDNVIAMFELTIQPDERVVIVQEKHYRLVPASDIGEEDLRVMATAAGLRDLQLRPADQGAPDRRLAVADEPRARKRPNKRRH